MSDEARDEKLTRQIERECRVRYEAERDAYEDLDMPGVFFPASDFEAQYHETMARLLGGQPIAMLRPSIISKLLARRRKIISKAKRITPDDSGVHSAIAAMSNVNRKANEL